MTGPRVITLGCRLNTLESEIIRSQTDNVELDKAIVVNTCAVTAQAVRQSRQTIRRLRREHPEDQIIVTGCAAQLNPKKFASMKGPLEAKIFAVNESISFHQLLKLKNHFDKINICSLSLIHI